MPLASPPLPCWLTGLLSPTWQLDAVMKGKQNEDLLLRLYALNESDAKMSGGIDWRQKLESQRGAVLANELKNNSNKLAKWTIQATTVKCLL